TLVVALLAHDQARQPAFAVGVARVGAISAFESVPVMLLFEHGRRGHPVERLDVWTAAIGPDHERAVALAHQQQDGLWQGCRGTADVGDLTASDDQTHRRTVSAAADLLLLVVRVQVDRLAELAHALAERTRDLREALG